MKNLQARDEFLKPDPTVIVSDNDPYGEENWEVEPDRRFSEDEIKLLNRYEYEVDNNFRGNDFARKDVTKDIVRFIEKKQRKKTF
jgi:hypothetical protein